MITYDLPHKRDYIACRSFYWIIFIFLIFYGFFLFFPIPSYSQSRNNLSSRKVKRPVISSKVGITDQILKDINESSLSWEKEMSDRYGSPDSALQIRLQEIAPSKKEVFGSYQPLADSTIDVSLMIMSSIAILYMAPESVSKWEGDDRDLGLNRLKEKWKDHIKEGPVVDNDEDWINYIGHPYFGAGYYNHTIHLGYSRRDALLYSIFMSTCVYEYGFEALFEIPSSQDLYITPLVGALWGELFLVLEQRIKRNKNTVLGSRRLGGICRSLLDPIGYPIQVMHNMNDKWLQLDMEATYFAEYFVEPYDLPGDDIQKDLRYGFLVRIYRK